VITRLARFKRAKERGAQRSSPGGDPAVGEIMLSLGFGLHDLVGNEKPALRASVVCWSLTGARRFLAPRGLGLARQESPKPPKQPPQHASGAHVCVPAQVTCNGPWLSLFAPSGSPVFG